MKCEEQIYKPLNCFTLSVIVNNAESQIKIKKRLYVRVNIKNKQIITVID